MRPPFYALFLAPLAWLPFGAAFWAWLGVQVSVLAGTWLWAFRRWGADALILGSMYLPTALGIAHGQDCVLILWIVLGVYALEMCIRDRRRPGASDTSRKSSWYLPRTRAAR